MKEPTKVDWSRCYIVRQVVKSILLQQDLSFVALFMYVFVL